MSAEGPQEATALSDRVKASIRRNLAVLNRLESHLGCALCHGPLSDGRCAKCQGPHGPESAVPDDVT